MLEYTKANLINVMNAMQVILPGYSLQLLSPCYQGHENNPMFGHCIHASEAIILLFPAEEFQLMRAKCEVADYHWYLLDSTGVIVDPTIDQYYYAKIKPPYDKGKPQNRTYGRDSEWNDRYLSKSYFVKDKVIEYLTGGTLTFNN